jgi:hypothetical protein
MALFAAARRSPSMSKLAVVAIAAFTLLLAGYAEATPLTGSIAVAVSPGTKARLCQGL